jgi:hypothetical protein
LQCEFDVVAAAGDWAAEALFGRADPVLDRVLVQHQPSAAAL